MRTMAGMLGLSLILICNAFAAPADPNGLDSEGFIQKWLVLAPIPIADGDSGSDALAKQQVKDEARFKPKAGDKLKVGGTELVWKAHSCTDHLLDFNAFMGATTEDSVGYAVTFVTAPDMMKDLKMKIGSDDQCKVWLNGKEVFKYTDERSADKDQDTVDVSLQKGVNVLVAKVVNVKADWSFCVRFTDKKDKPLTNLKASSAGG
jgi:hypothetical protein